MSRNVLSPLLSIIPLCSVLGNEPWNISSEGDWKESTANSSNLDFKEGMAVPNAKESSFTSKLKSFPEKKSASSLLIKQSPVWHNWNPISNIGPVNLNDAPVMLSLGPDNYWMFGLHGGAKKNGAKQKEFTGKAAELEGFDIELKTTRYPNQFNAPGGLKKSKGGYHAWQSKDMVNWVHHGPITEKFSRWMTSAEYVDGKAYFYYDFPNDQDPHLYIDQDLTDGEPGKNMGIAFKDPSDGSDAGFIRDLDGKFHVIYEDWSPIEARKRSWDSPLAGHAVSEDGIGNFKIGAPAVDHRTKPTGKTATYKHPHWTKEDPKNFKTDIATYEIHEPAQPAYGDWATIAIGGQYYLFGDYDPAGSHQMSVAWFTSPSIDQPFEFCGNIGKGHPDPDIMFAEGQFYLATQPKTDFVSPGPWVEKVEARVGVDTNNDGKVNEWSKWQAVKETYDHLKGFAKQIKKTPATLDLSNLPDGYGFQIELKMTDTTDNQSIPIIDQLTLSFD